MMLQATGSLGTVDSISERVSKRDRPLRLGKGNKCLLEVCLEQRADIWHREYVGGLGG